MNSAVGLVQFSWFPLPNSPARCVWKCEKCARLGITNCPLALSKISPYTVVANSKIDRFRVGETRPIACLVHAAVARRRAEQEVDPRFNRLVALTLVNQM